MFKYFNILLISAILVASSVSAETLDDLINSREFTTLKKKLNRKKAHSLDTVWLDNSSNKGLIFTSLDGARFVETWLALSSKKYKLVNRSGEMRDELLISKRRYQSPTNKLIMVRTVLPHPHYETMAKFNLLNEFAELEPPKVNAEYTEELQIGERPAAFYHLKDCTCSILLKLEHETRVYLNTACENSKEMKELATLFSYDRFVKKLNS